MVIKMAKIIRLGPTHDDVTYYLPIELPDVFALYRNRETLYCIKCDLATHKIPEYLCNVPNNCKCRLRFHSIDTMYQNITTLVETYKERYSHVGLQ